MTRLKTYRIAILLTLIIVSLIISTIALIFKQANVLLTPHRNSNIGEPVGISQPYREVTLTGRDGLAISGWYIEGWRPHGLVVVHGIHANRLGILPEARLLNDAGYPLFLPDLRGHGLSEGDMVTYGYLEAYDVLAAVDYLLEQDEIEQVGVMGHSLGGAVAVRATAQDTRIAALVVQSSYSSLPSAIDSAFDNLAVLPKWPFAPLVISVGELESGLSISDVDSARDLRETIRQPVMIIHGTEDGLFPVEHGRRMFEAARSAKTLWIVEGMPHHNAADFAPDEYRARVLPFLAQAFEAQKR